MNEQDLQHLANLLMSLHVELARKQRELAAMSKELEDLRKLHEPAGEEN